METPIDRSTKPPSDDETADTLARALVSIETLQNELKARTRLIWMLVEAAGGKITITRDVMDKFQEQHALITQTLDLKTGGKVFEALEGKRE